MTAARTTLAAIFVSGSLFVVVVAPAAPPVAGEKPAPSAASGERPPVYETEVAPLFATKCSRCHGEKDRKGDLDLGSPAGIRKGGESGPVVIANDPGKSLLYEKVLEGEMPPGRKDRLSQAEVATIRRWIEAGALWGAETENDGDNGSQPVSQHDVIPILLRRCTVCHGARQREGELDLRTKAAMLQGGKSGPAIAPGDPDASLLIKRIRSGEMPPLTRLIEVSVKPIEPAEIEVLARWIASGSPEVDDKPDVATTEPDPLVSDKDRAFWSFQPPQAARPPAVANGDRLRNPIDSFILARLESRGLSFSAEAERTALLRRVSFDLTGLPPEPGEVDSFLGDNRPDAYERLVDRLLASPRYGERWGRHWLDLAGYADSEGKREQDIPRRSAWRYRDYVIRAFNSDKPYDRFLYEQLAGDELADYEHAPEITPELYDNLVATGFLRMAPDPTWFNLTNFIPDRLDVVADEIDVLGSAVLGLTMKCARCHSHKFDPIPHRDYFRLVDIFKGAFDEHDWMKANWHNGLSMGQRSDRDLAFVTAAERREWEDHTAKLQKEISARNAALDGQAESLSKKDRAEIAALESQKRPEPKIRALWDRGDPSPTYIYRRGDYLSPGRLVGPGVPSVLTDGKTPFEVVPPWPGAKQTGRRLVLARWLTRPEHPLTVRVFVNRLWKHHFGTGLVKTLDNFGKTGMPPTHPELLDWLAREFVRSGWGVKAIQRLMVTSSTYRQTSAITPVLEADDPENVLYSRMPLQRLSADQLYDTLLAVAGRLDETRFGPADAVDARPDGLVVPRRTERGWRRSIYVQQQRKMVVTGLECFDFPQMNPNCIERRDSTVVLQALHLMNNGMVHELAESLASRIEAEAGGDPAQQIERAFLVMLARSPNAEELSLGQSSLSRMTGRWQALAAANAEANGPSASQKALAAFCHALLNSAEFLYVD